MVRSAGPRKYERCRTRRVDVDGQRPPAHAEASSLLRCARAGDRGDRSLREHSSCRSAADRGDGANGSGSRTCTARCACWPRRRAGEPCRTGSRGRSAVDLVGRTRGVRSRRRSGRSTRCRAPCGPGRGAAPGSPATTSLRIDSGSRRRTRNAVRGRPRDQAGRRSGAVGLCVRRRCSRSAPARSVTERGRRALGRQPAAHCRLRDSACSATGGADPYAAPRSRRSESRCGPERFYDGFRTDATASRAGTRSGRSRARPGRRGPGRCTARRYGSWATAIRSDPVPASRLSGQPVGGRRAGTAAPWPYACTASACCDPLDAAELCDGTLRYCCGLAALHSREHLCAVRPQRAGDQPAPDLHWPPWPTSSPAPAAGAGHRGRRTRRCCGRRAAGREPDTREVRAVRSSQTRR
jgi:hypothetical protein